MTTFRKKCEQLRKKVKDKKVLHDHLYNGDQKPMVDTVTVDSTFVENFNAGVELVKETKTLFEKLDTNDNNILESEELMKGAFEVIPLLAKIVAFMGALIGAIGTVRSVLNKEFDYILFIIIGVLFITFTTVVIVIKKTNQAASLTITKINKDFKTLVKLNNLKHETHYGDLKGRFIKIKNSAEGLQEQYYQLMASNTTKQGHIAVLLNEIKKTNPNFDGFLEEPDYSRIKRLPDF